jgi:hypothetical protein
MYSFNLRILKKGFSHCTGQKDNKNYSYKKIEEKLKMKKFYRVDCIYTLSYLVLRSYFPNTIEIKSNLQP